MIGFIRGILTACLTIFLLLFAITNRHDVELFWNPLGDKSTTLPLSVLVLVFMACAFVMGCIITWLGEARVRKDRRLQRKQIKTLEKDLSKAGFETNDSAPPADFFPSLIKRK